MGTLHSFVLSIGSNIEPERNLTRVMGRLRAHGRVLGVSGAWKSHAIGAAGPDFLNICVQMECDLEARELKHTVLRPIEKELGRRRAGDPNAPRPIDIDIMFEDGRPHNLPRWAFPFVIVPMAELLPDIEHPTQHRRLAEVAADAREKTWIVPAPVGLYAGDENS
jgi:2-amino-4-hydroxy-6-hydroxymethyldihydropteridine diphosphokinase